MWLKGISLGLMLYAVFITVNVSATVRAIANSSAPTSGEVGVDLVTLYHNCSIPWLSAAFVGCILVGVSFVASWPRVVPAP